MKYRLLWKLLLINIVPVISVFILVIWLAIDKLAANYFMALMKNYDVSPTDIHQMFLTAIHHYLLWASLVALFIAFIINYMLTSRVLRPLSQMSAITRQVAAGNYSHRVAVTTQDEVGQLGIAFNQMADSLAEVEQLRKNMVADLAHELRTPLTNLRGYLEALHDEVLPPTHETFQILQQETLHLVRLVENLQQLAKADAAKSYLKRENVYIETEIIQLLKLYQSNFNDKKISIETCFPSSQRTVSADRDKILQALRNLIENAWKYTPHYGRLTIFIKHHETYTKIGFNNSGPQIPEDILPYIFERFFRGDRSRSRNTGSAGLGLAIVKELIEAHGGEVGASSSQNLIKIWLILPL